MTTLHQAARAGDLSELRRLIEQGAGIEDYEKKTGHTPLMAACLSPEAGVEVVDFLLDQGADVNARHRPETAPLASADDAADELDSETQLEFNAQMAKMLDDIGVSPETREMIENARQSARKQSTSTPETPPLISLAVVGSSCEKIRLLIEHGADLQYRSSHGYNLLTLAACPGREDAIDLLLAAGAPVDGQSDYKESALSVLSREGRFAAVGKILNHGADPSPLEWTPLMKALALGSLQEVQTRLDEGADLEAVDCWKRTPFLLSIHTGDTAKSALLLAHGANRQATGRCGKPPLIYAIERDDATMLEWLIGEGCDLTQTDEFKTTPLQAAVEHGAVACFHRLLAAGADWTQADKHNDPLIKNASHPEIIQTLINLGANPGDLDTGELRKWIGLPTIDDLPVTKSEFLANRTRCFGTSNPETMNLPFWQAMVRNGWDGYQAATHFETESYGEPPVWCYRRFGMSLTALPGGRFVQIAGEHEDHYDPDFCIYNDVILHDGKGGFDILGYPEEVFPPTDFHSATLVGEWIYLIGNLGHRPTHEAFAGETPVFRLHVGTWRIERVTTTGPTPGWVHRHVAKLEAGKIHIAGGKILTNDESGKGHIDDFLKTWTFDLAAARWHHLDT